jgi:hypothetical protein
MGFNIENLVKVIKDFGKLTADNLDDFENNEILNIELVKVKNESELFQEVFNEYLENQLKINFDATLFDLILEELNVVETEFYVRYHKIRQSNNSSKLKLKSIAILREIEYKISFIHIITGKLELNKNYSGYLGISESKTTISESNDESFRIKGEWNVRQLYYYLEKLKIIDLLSKQFPNKEHRHLIVSKIIPLHHSNIKKLSYGTYKGIEISSEEKKEVDSFIQKFS